MIGQYANYFEYVASKHPLLNHVAEIGKRTFDVIPQSDVKDFDMIRTEIDAAADFAMVAVIPTLELQERTDAGVNRTYTGAFFVLKKYSSRNDEKRSWYGGTSEAEGIAEDILQRIVKDSRNKHPLFHRSCDTMGALNYRMLERKVSNWSGLLVTFNFSNIMPDCPNTTTNWLDNGLTPYNK
jgi:hypothetical protein